MIKLLFGYSMPLWFVLFGITSEWFGIESNPYYAVVGYTMGLISVTSIISQEM